MSVTNLKKKVKEAPGFSLDDILSSAAAPSKDPKSKSKVPVLSVGPEIKGLVTRIRQVKAELDSAESMFDALSAELVTGISTLRAALCKREYQSAVKVPGEDGQSVGVSWSHKYSKIPYENAAALKEIVGDEFPNYFTTKTAIAVKDVDEAKLRELIQFVGPERFAEFFSVERVLAPTERYTHEFHTAFSDGARERLAQVVKQNKPSIKAR